MQTRLKTPEWWCPVCIDYVWQPILDPSDAFRCDECYAALLPYEHIIPGRALEDAHPPPLPAYIAEEELKKEREIRNAVRKLAEIIRCPHCEK